jgi:hypothetical protein
VKGCPATAGGEPNRKLAVSHLGQAQDIGSYSKYQKCGLKYVIHNPGKHEKSGAEAPRCSLRNE